MFVRTIALTALLALASAAPARAAFVVTIASQTVNQGDTATLDVTITSTDSERLDAFFGEFVLTSFGGAPLGGVRFVVESGELPPLPPLFESNYVFFANSSVAPFNSASVYKTDLGWTGGDTYLVSDAALNEGVVDVALKGADVSGGKLLARLTVKVEGGATVGSKYVVKYGTSGSSYLDNNGNEILTTFEGGEITVGPAATATPAPPGLVLFVSGALPVLGWIVRQRRARAAATA